MVHGVLSKEGFSLEDNLLTQPTFTIRLGREQFQNEICCLGEQFAQLLACIQQDTAQLSWYAFDVFGSSNQSLDNLFPRPYCEINSTVDLIKMVKEIVQFHSGVFIGIKRDRNVEWHIDRLPETEEGEGLQHPDAEIEIRPFDTTYFEIYGVSSSIENKILSCFE